jgi:hypothetical protein
MMPSSSKESIASAPYKSDSEAYSGSILRTSVTNVLYTVFILSKATEKSSIVFLILFMISASIGPSMMERSNLTAFYLSSSTIEILSPMKPLILSSLSELP